MPTSPRCFCSPAADEAAEALEQALVRYERKGNLVMAARTRDRLGALRGERPSCRSSAKAMFRHPEAEGATTSDR